MRVFCSRGGRGNPGECSWDRSYTTPVCLDVQRFGGAGVVIILTGRARSKRRDGPTRASGRFSSAGSMATSGNDCRRSRRRAFAPVPGERVRRRRRLPVPISEATDRTISTGNDFLASVCVAGKERELGVASTRECLLRTGRDLCSIARVGRSEARAARHVARRRNGGSAISTFVDSRTDWPRMSRWAHRTPEVAGR